MSLFGTDPEYQPKHLKPFDDSLDHCCFAGCRPMACPGRCCANMGWHRASCPQHPSREYDEAMAGIYIDRGLPKHLRVDFHPDLD